jgi:hypothetical protein
MSPSKRLKKHYPRDRGKDMSLSGFFRMVLSLEFPYILKMLRFKIGDSVRVSQNVFSDYAGRVGIVVAAQQRGVSSPIECEIEFTDGTRRRFVSFQLRKLSVSTRENVDGATQSSLLN